MFWERSSTLAFGRRLRPAGDRGLRHAPPRSAASWGSRTATWATARPSTTVYFDETELTRPAYEELGDFAVATALSLPYALAARAQADLSIDDGAATRSAVCLTGWYAAQWYNGAFADSLDACRSAPATSTRRCSSSSTTACEDQVFPNVVGLRLRARRGVPASASSRAATPASSVADQRRVCRRPTAAMLEACDVPAPVRVALVSAALAGLLGVSGCVSVVVGRPSAQPVPQRRPTARSRSSVPTTGRSTSWPRNALADLEVFWAEPSPRSTGRSSCRSRAATSASTPTTSTPASYPHGVGCGARPLEVGEQRLLLPVAPQRAELRRDHLRPAFLAELADDYGQFLPALVMAHEFGHAVQARVGLPGRRSPTETQADCLAGAWTRWVADGRGRALAACAGRSSTSCSAATCCCATRSAPAPPRSRRTAPTSTGCRPSRRASTAGPRPAATTSARTGFHPGRVHDGRRPPQPGQRDRTPS